VSLAIRSGYRTHAKQKKLYKQYRRGEGNLAAKPGYSVHESGRALDLVVTQHKTYEWLVAHAREYGFHRTVHGEPWHWEYLGGSDATAVERGVSREKPHDDDAEQEPIEAEPLETAHELADALTGDR
jgi:LAS superfamily LD-carboxypeptidase LdcB